MLNIILEFRKGILFIRLDGELTKRTMVKYGEEVLEMIKENRIKDAVINMDKLYLIDLKGINLLYNTYELIRDNKGVMLLCKINNLIRDRISKSHLLKYVKETKDELESFNKIAI